MSGAERLREAAALMRERAEAATAGPWSAEAIGSEGYRVYGPRGTGGSPLARRRHVIAFCGHEKWDEDRAAAEHIASWHPAVALAVARWLEDESHAPETDLGDGITTGGPRMEALAVAEAYLADTPP